jgi:hypothetical protein
VCVCVRVCACVCVCVSVCLSVFWPWNLLYTGIVQNNIDHVLYKKKKEPRGNSIIFFGPDLWDIETSFSNTHPSRNPSSLIS